MMAGNANDPAATIQGTYTSPSTSRDFSYTILSAAPASDSDVQSRTAYLAELGASTKKLQEDINAFLTVKMEEEKASGAQNGVSGATQKSGEELEEENYGEEAAEGDEA